MRRWGIVSCLILIVAFALSAPAAAQALTVSGGQLSSGSPVNTKISTVGQEIEYTFSATAGENVTFNVTNFNFTGNGSSPAFYLVFFEPGSSSQYTSCTFTGNNYCRFSPPQSGTWSILLEPVGSSVGSLTLTFASNVATQSLESGVAAPTTIKFEGQYAQYTFSATAGKNVTFNVTNFNFTGNGSSPAFYLVFFEPGSNSQYTSCTFTGNNYCRFSPPQSGTWSILLEPVGTSVGSLTLTSANNVASITLGPRFAVGTTIKFEGQYAQYTFDATAGNSVAFDVTDFKFSGNGSSPAFYLVFFEPGSNSQYTSCTFAGNGSCDISPPQSGAWSILLEPVGTSVGSLTIEMA
jgi:hypothetical protein